MTRLPESEHELEELVRERTGNIAQYLAAIVESSDDAIVSKDLHGMIRSWNGAAERIFGYTSAEAVGRPITIVIPRDRHGEEPDILERIGRGERIEQYETVRQRKDGRLIDVALTISPVKNARGEIIGASKIARDITERKRREVQMTTLAREAEHRARNILSLVLATVQLSQADTTQELKKAIEGRVQALSNVISLFTESRWRGAELRRLVTQELSPFCEGNRCQIDGPELMLNPVAAQAIAMTLHELATNAAKYGALSAANGQVNVYWSRAADDQMILRWTELGGPYVRFPEQRGFGSQLMDAMIHGQLRGRITFDWRVAGLVCEIAIPLK
jgi:PAS domain S-box-containing protein